ncbi:MAG TPA: alkaline phosphatase family protein, partial [Methanotrichaceae archaeon]|nr:alkaline phosphatase family protein [Methanotrichaceae archaeon]
YPELEARALDGSPLGGALLFNLTGNGARIQNVTVPVPTTGPSHSVLVTGCSWADPANLGTPGATIFDAARENGLICLAILQRGDSISMVLEQDGILLFDDNSLWGAEPLFGSRALLPSDLADLFQIWRNRFPLYNQDRGVPGYVGYNAWGLDAAADIVENMESRPFLLMLNVGAVDSAGHNLGPEGYVGTISGLDVPLGRLIEVCEANGVLLLITADHGMSFTSDRGKGGHSSSKYSSGMESVRVPAVFIGPGVDDLVLTGNWSEVDLVSTLLDLLGLSPALPLSEGQVIPVSSCCDLEVDVGTVSDVEIRKSGDLVARATGDSRYIFRNLDRGSYSVESGEREAFVYLWGDQFLDLASGSARSSKEILPSIFDWQNRKFVAAIMILVINVIGAVLIFRIIRRG